MNKICAKHDVIIRKGSSTCPTCTELDVGSKWVRIATDLKAKVEELERALEKRDILIGNIHSILMNPDTSDDRKWEAMTATLGEAGEKLHEARKEGEGRKCV